MQKLPTFQTVKIRALNAPNQFVVQISLISCQNNLLFFKPFFASLLVNARIELFDYSSKIKNSITVIKTLWI